MSTVKLIFANRVITGIRFVNFRKVIYLQIEQGELLGDGIIANNTEWINPDEEGNYNERDFMSLTWEERAIDLHDLTAEPGHCLTGTPQEITSNF